MDLEIETIDTGGEVPFPIVRNTHRVRVTRTLQGVRPEDVYAFWRRFENHPMFIENLEGVEILDERRSRWRWNVKPFGLEIEWVCEIIADHPGKMVSWQTLPGSQIHQAGSAWFLADGDNNTEIQWQVAWDPPAGELGEFMAKILGEDPAHTMHAALKRLQSLLEPRQTMNRGQAPSLS